MVHDNLHDNVILGMTIEKWLQEFRDNGWWKFYFIHSILLDNNALGMNKLGRKHVHKYIATAYFIVLI